MPFGSIAKAFTKGALGLAGFKHAGPIGSLVGAGVDLLSRRPRESGFRQPGSLPGPPKLSPDISNFRGVRPGQPPSGPAFLMGEGGLSSGMTDLQRRANVATRATQGEASGYRDPATLEYYRNLALHSLTDPRGDVLANARVLPIERQYLTDILGQQPRNESVASFLSALLRAS